MNLNAKPVISLVSCEDYSRDKVRDRLSELLEPLSGIAGFVKPGQRVALKLNLLLGASPEQCVCTHPEVARAVAELVLKAGGKPFLVDSPGAAIPHKSFFLQRLYEKCGLKQLGIPLNTDEGYRSIPIPHGRIVKRMEILAPLLEADVIINLPKVKTHSFMILTCAVKNMFGAIPGYLKVGYHSKLKSPEQFGAMLLDVAETVKPALTIVDGIKGMEGEGPSGGNPKNLGILAAGTDPVATDFVICKLIGFPPEKVPYLALAQKEKLCPSEISDVDLRTDKEWESLSVKFAPPSTMSGKALAGFYPSLLNIFRPFINYAFTLRPEVSREKCVGCGACASACPEKIIEMRKTTGGKKFAYIKRRNCIRCYCCHEMCPYKAIVLKKSLLYRLLN
ncbi:DUF362 domain-containing protein [Candidatus Sumerlaeota bacterium]|nr:DUF362 domain-containing protein [Candidatus Sumerlaeota bacterium]